ncbi:MAG: riboflavin synthase [Chloroflexi bacterium]|nr:riboflavin synthase [Chloroflexota bacterium]
MFSGIVEELGEVLRRSDQGLVIRAHTVLTDLQRGASIAINGACLTVVDFGHDWFQVDVVPETWQRTNLGAAQPGTVVNLERALPATGRIGGHFVQGHVDGTAEVIALDPVGNEVRACFAVAPALARYIVNKGFIALDGVSLTVVEAGEERFTIALIPHTREQTTLGRLRIGDRVNVEVDILGKYVERFVQPAMGSTSTARAPGSAPECPSGR